MTRQVTCAGCGEPIPTTASGEILDGDVDLPVFRVKRVVDDPRRGEIAGEDLLCGHECMIDYLIQGQYESTEGSVKYGLIA